MELKQQQQQPPPHNSPPPTPLPLKGSGEISWVKGLQKMVKLLSSYIQLINGIWDLKFQRFQLTLTSLVYQHCPHPSTPTHSHLPTPALPTNAHSKIINYTTICIKSNHDIRSFSPSSFPKNTKNCWLFSNLNANTIITDGLYYPLRASSLSLFLSLF